MSEGPFQPFNELTRLTVSAQERGFDIAKRWSDAVLQLLQDQVEGNRAVLTAVTTSLTAMERALASQEETNRAFREAIEAQRAAVEQVRASQERGVELLQTTMTSLVSTLQGQLEAARALLAAPTAAAGPAGELMQQWIAAYRQLMDAATPKPHGGRSG